MQYVANLTGTYMGNICAYIFHTCHQNQLCNQEDYIFFTNYISCNWHITLKIIATKLQIKLSHSYFVLAIDKTVACICSKSQLPTTSALHIITIHVLEINIPIKLQIYGMYLMGIYNRYAYMCPTWCHWHQPCDKDTVHIFHKLYFTLLVCIIEV